MNPQERDVINGIFDRLKQAEGQPRDAEVEALISERLTAQPGAAYLLAQIVHVQEQALSNLNDRVNALEAEAAQAQAAQASAAPAGGGFLASLFGASTPPNQQGQQAPRASAPGRPQPQQGNRGPWNSQSAGPQAEGPQAAGLQSAGPWGNRGGAGGGFLASAMTTAAGVAGGMMLGNVLTNAFGLNSGASTPAGDKAASSEPQAAAPQAAAEPAAQDTADAGQSDATYQEATYDEGLDGGFDDFGGGDDWI